MVEKFRTFSVLKALHILIDVIRDFKALTVSIVAYDHISKAASFCHAVGVGVSDAIPWSRLLLNYIYTPFVFTGCHWLHCRQMFLNSA